jgi:micrococcal nuclease
MSTARGLDGIVRRTTRRRAGESDAASIRSRWGVAFLAALALAGCAATPPASAPEAARRTAASQAVEPPAAATLARVVDGDTLHVTLPGGDDQTLRLIGINTPETTKGKHECLGAEATTRLTELVTGQTLTVTADPTQADTDRYGRSIRYIDLPDGTDVQLTLISDGLAHEVQYGRKYQRQGRYVDAERAAKTEQRGGWAPTNRGGCGWS